MINHMTHIKMVIQPRLEVMNMNMFDSSTTEKKESEEGEGGEEGRRKRRWANLLPGEKWKWPLTFLTYINVCM